MKCDLMFTMCVCEHVRKKHIFLTVNNCIDSKNKKNQKSENEKNMGWECPCPYTVTGGVLLYFLTLQKIFCVSELEIQLFFQTKSHPITFSIDSMSFLKV